VVGSQDALLVDQNLAELGFGFGGFALGRQRGRDLVTGGQGVRVVGPEDAQPVGEYLPMLSFSLGGFALGRQCCGHAVT
jgi:hypothetical protein